MIEIQGVSKRFGAKQVLDSVSFIARDGAVTGFLGPNGAGKSTTMRVLLGLVNPDNGATAIDGQSYRKHTAPLASVGAVLDAKSAHRGRSAEAHLRAVAASNNIPSARVDEVIALAGLEDVRGKKAGSFSLGMSQRLAIATAMLGDPHNLVLDEPVNGLDPEGVKWVRDLCRRWAGEGRCVLLSSHLMSEVALTADDLVIIGRGRIIEHTSVNDFVAKHSRNSLRVTTPQADKLYRIFEHAQGVQLNEMPVEQGLPQDARSFEIIGAELQAAAQTFAQAQLVMYRFAQAQASLEQAYMELTHGYDEYQSRMPRTTMPMPQPMPQARQFQHYQQPGVQPVPMTMPSPNEAPMNGGMPR